MFSLQNWFVIAIVCVSCLAQGQPIPEGRLMRFPDICKDKITFMYGGDLWLAPSSGGVARRITSHPGRELFPKFSPDGNWIAFTGQYDGNFNVYVMPAEGGQPRQLTFYQGGAPLSDRMGVNNEVLTWTPDGKRILFLSRRDAWNGWTKRAFRWADIVLFRWNQDRLQPDFPKLPHLETLYRRARPVHLDLRSEEQQHCRRAPHRLDRHFSHVARRHHFFQLRPRPGTPIQSL